PRRYPHPVRLDVRGGVLRAVRFHADRQDARPAPARMVGVPTLSVLRRVQRERHGQAHGRRAHARQPAGTATGSCAARHPLSNDATQVQSGVSRKVLLAHTGGTIGMHRGPRGFEPRQGYLAELLGRMPELTDPRMPEIALVEWGPLLDSADNRPADWQRMAHEIAAHYDDIDGVVLLHGTDTMAYTSSALSFLLAGLGKPVIITGSQVPLAEVRSDARENLVASLQLAARTDLHEVCVYFSGHVLRGCRATKVSASGFDAFESPNQAPLGQVGVDISLRAEALRPAQAG